MQGAAAALWETGAPALPPPPRVGREARVPLPCSLGVGVDVPELPAVPPRAVLVLTAAAGGGSLVCH